MPSVHPTFRAAGEDAQRMVIVGATGSGKTTKAREIVELARAGHADVVYFDVKGLNDFGFPVVSAESIADPEALTKALDDEETNGAITVMLDPFGDPIEQLDTAARSAFVRGNLLFVLDDAMGVEGSKVSKWIGNIITQGRARGVGFLAIVQRIHWVPLIFLTEAEHIVTFEIHGEADRDRLERDGHPELAAAGGLQRFEYLWYSREDRSVVAFAPIALTPSTN